MPERAASLRACAASSARGRSRDRAGRLRFASAVASSGLRAALFADSLGARSLSPPRGHPLARGLGLVERAQGLPLLLGRLDSARSAATRSRCSVASSSCAAPARSPPSRPPSAAPAIASASSPAGSPPRAAPLRPPLRRARRNRPSAAKRRSWSPATRPARACDRRRCPRHAPAPGARRVRLGNR